MNCSEFWSEADRQTALSSDLQKHVAACPPCAARWENQLALSRGMRALADDWSSVEAPPRVEAGLRAAYRVQMGTRRPVYHSRWAPVLAWASAAAATIAIAMALLHPAQPSAVSPNHTASPQHAAPSAETASADELDFENDFVQVPNAPRIEPNEDVNLVRVEVSRSAMMAMGIPVSSGDASETVTADVVLGADGQARAVRVVTDGSTLE